MVDEDFAEINESEVDRIEDQYEQWRYEREMES